jgi:hypothetical protein
MSDYQPVRSGEPAAYDISEILGIADSVLVISYLTDNSCVRRCVRRGDAPGTATRRHWSAVLSVEAGRGGYQEKNDEQNEISWHAMTVAFAAPVALAERWRVTVSFLRLLIAPPKSCISRRRLRIAFTHNPSLP